LAVGIAWYLLKKRLARWLVSTAAEFERQISVAADRAGTVHERLPPSVFFKPIGDEAALALTWTSAMATLMQAASQLLFRVLQFISDSWLSIPRYGRIIATVAGVVVWSVGTAVLAVFTLLADGSGTAAKLANAIREVVPPGVHLGSFDVAHLIWDLPAVFALVMWFGLMLALTGLAAMTLIAWLAAAGAGIPTCTRVLA
jgi:hypothetical protein